MARKSLDDILDGNDEPETEVDAVEAETPDPEPQAEETGVEPEQQEAEPEAVPPTADKLPQDVYAPLKAVRDENKTLKDQLDALRKEIEANKQKEPEQPAPSIWEDDQAWQQHFGGQVVNQAAAVSAYQSKLNTSEFYARKNIEGFDTEWEPLNKWLSENPTVGQQASADYDPWGYAWRAYSNQKTMQELGATDLDTLKAKMREELLAELQTGAPPKAPQTLSNKRSVASRTGPAWGGPKSLDELLG